MVHQCLAERPPRRKRRRRIGRPPISSWLKASEDLKGNVAIISSSLYKNLFCDDMVQVAQPERPKYIAITPWSPLVQDPTEEGLWTILPVVPQPQAEEAAYKLDTTGILLPNTSPALQLIIGDTSDNAVKTKAVKQKKGIEVRVVDIEPLVLDRIYVTVDGDALQKHEEVQKKFGGGFDYTRTNGFMRNGKAKGKANSHVTTDGMDSHVAQKEQEARLTSAVREALTAAGVARQDELLPLPLPAHPITHVPLPPARIVLCEPVNQGLLSPTTKVIINQVKHSDLARRVLPSIAAQKTTLSSTLEDGDDTANEHFFSAVENEDLQRTNTNKTTERESNSESSFDSSSDDSTDNLISLNVPQLQSRPSGAASARSRATSRGARSILNGFDTPGSVSSNFTATTARPKSGTQPRQFHAHGLLHEISDELLHPRPAANEDNEARIFTNMKALMRLGCFSGDWVQVSAASASGGARIGAWDRDRLHLDDLTEDVRPVKIYGLSDLPSGSTNRCPKRQGSGRRSSIVAASSSENPGMSVWLSPILLANLGQPLHVRVSPLISSLHDHASTPVNRQRKLDSSASPPVAKEMNLLRLSTPLSTERALQTGIFSALKHYFETRRRILRQGDLISLPIDKDVSRLLAQSSNVTENGETFEDILSIPSGAGTHTSENIGIVWFKVGHIVATETEGDSHFSDGGLWGGAACIEPLLTRMRQAGSEISKTPSTSDNSWQYYLGFRPLPKWSDLRVTLAQYVAPMRKPFTSILKRRLRELIAAATSPRALHLGMDPVVILLHSTQRNIGKASLLTAALSDLGLHLFDIDAHDITSEGGSSGDVKAEALLKARVERASSCGASVTAILIRHIENLTADRMITAVKETIAEVRVMVATTTDIDGIPESMRSLFTHEIEVLAPDEAERESILRNVIDERSLRIAQDVDLGSIAIKSAALVAGDLVDIVERAVTAKQTRLEQLSSKSSSEHSSAFERSMRDTLLSGGEAVHCVTKADFNVAVEAARKNFADAIGAPKIPNVSWDDVGGLENVKDAVMETIQLPLEKPELFAKGMKKRSGILFYGPPGTGKTLLAKAIATEFSLNFFSVKGPELLNMYIGESEANVRRVFQRARDARPCVVFFDELDSVAPKRGNQGDSGGVMDRIVSQLLAELDGMSDGEEGGGGVFVIGATNRPDLLDQALLRPGRFDKMLYLGVSDTHDKQLTIMEALTRKFTMHPQMSLRRVAESLPFTYTGADLYALCSDAMLKAITRQSSAVDAKIRALPGGLMSTAYFFDHIATGEDVAVMVTEGDFYAAQRELVGSVRYVNASLPMSCVRFRKLIYHSSYSAKELDHYHRVRQQFEGPAKPQTIPSRVPHVSRIPGPTTTPDGHLEPPKLATRPKIKDRSSTIKPKAKQEPKGKGKGKATQWDSDEDDDDDAYVTSNDFADTPERRHSSANGFGDAAGDDEKDLYG